MKKRVISMMLALALVLGMTSMVSAASHPFTDVSSSAWYGQFVEYVYEHGMMSGTSSTKFGPNETMTRAMTVTVLYQLAGKPEVTSSNPFTDVPAGKWYTNAVLWAVANGITSGTSATKFSPNANVTREQLVTFLYRYAETLEKEMNSYLLLGYNDYSQVAKYAQDPFCWAVGEGIISGTDATHLSPKNQATRAQCATILTRFDQWVGDESTSTDPDHEHKYVKGETVAPTCSEKGYTIYECACGDSYHADEVEIDESAHNYSVEEDGDYLVYTCQYCGDEYSEYTYEPTEEFKREVAAYVVQYINQFRNEQGACTCEVLPRMTLVAEYRAMQLITNFAHDGSDMKEAYAYYEFGDYTEMSDPADNYWAPHSREAIAKGGATNDRNAEQVGKEFATTIRNSENHWAYIGDNMYTYIGVGMEYSDGVWFCCIMVNDHADD